MPETHSIPLGRLRRRGGWNRTVSTPEGTSRVMHQATVRGYSGRQAGLSRLGCVGRATVSRLARGALGIVMCTQRVHGSVVALYSRVWSGAGARCRYCCKDPIASRSWIASSLLGDNRQPARDGQPALCARKSACRAKGCPISLSSSGRAVAASRRPSPPRDIRRRRRAQGQGKQADERSRDAGRSGFLGKVARPRRTYATPVGAASSVPERALRGPARMRTLR